MISSKDLATISKLGFHESALKALQEYLELLVSANEELNLISRKMSFEELIENHVIDSLLPLHFFPASMAKKVADFGSGGGLPAVIYALQFPDTQFYLYEKSPKKRDFLAACAKLVKNIHVEADIPPSFGDYDLVTARAFKPIDVILDVSRNYFNSGGKYFLLKGRREKIEEEILLAQKKFKNLAPGQLRIQKLLSPVLEVERHLVLIN